jgi:hypothetical protein
VLHRHKRRYGQKKGPGLKPPGLLAGVVHEMRDAAGRVVSMKAESLFG